MAQLLTVIVYTDQGFLVVLREMLGDAVYDSLIGQSPIDCHYLQIDLRQVTTDTSIAAYSSSEPQDAALEILQEIYTLLDELPFRWQVAVVKSLLTHLHIVANDHVPAPQHTTLSA
jgi:hypothetical protein